MSREVEWSALFPGSRRTSVRSLLSAGVALLLLLGASFAFDRWYQANLIARARQRQLAVVAPYASALESAVARRLSRLSGLKAFVESRPTAKQVFDEFPTFAEGLQQGTPGIRALQLVDNWRVVAEFPVVGNEAALGMRVNAAHTPNPAQRRAIETGRLTITGPLTLVQGGVGLIAIQAIRGKAQGYPDFVSMVLDVPDLLAEAKGSNTLLDFDFAVLDREGRSFLGDRSRLVRPDSIEVRVPDGSWLMLTAPRGGWVEDVVADLWPTRLASALITMLLAWLTYATVGRQERLVSAVDARTMALRSANDDLRREVDEREAAERQLERNAEQLRMTLAAGRMGTWDWSLDDDRLTWSDSVASLFAIDVDRAPTSAAAYRALVHPADQADVDQAVRDAVRQDHELAVEHRLAASHGEDRWVFVKGLPVRNHAGRTTRLLGVVIDITERRRLETQLLHSQKMEAVGTLAGGIAHDFNNLLTAILGFARLIQARTGELREDADLATLRLELNELRVDVDEVLKAGERAALLTSQLLAFSRRQVVRPTGIDLSTAVRDVELMLRRLIGERVTLETSLATVPVPVLADSGQLAQVVVNLVVNARDALPGGGRIRVRTRVLDVDDHTTEPRHGLPAGRWAVLTVSDNGVGMTPDVARRVFEPFFTTKEVGAGTGLGLSTVYGIVTQSGGHVLLDTSPGIGSTFRVALPALPDTSRVRQPTPAVTTAVSAGERILVVEDEPGVRRLASEILVRHGFVVHTAVDGGAALDQIFGEGTVPDLIVTDVVMPRVGGRALATELVRRGLDIPVVFMSGYPDSDGVPDQMGRAFVAKPFTPNALLRAVRDLLDAR